MASAIAAVIVLTVVSLGLLVRGNFNDTRCSLQAAQAVEPIDGGPDAGRPGPDAVEDSCPAK